MRRRLAVSALLVIGAITGVLAPSASAAPPAPVTLEATVTIPNPVFGGVWQASGAIDDSGTFVRTDVNLTGAFFNSPAVSAFQAVFVFSGTRGTLALRLQLSFTASGLTGVWEIASGTGAYERASGHGTSLFTFPNSLSLQGVVSKSS